MAHTKTCHKGRLVITALLLMCIVCISWCSGLSTGDADSLAQFNQELQSPEHPLRRLIESELGIGNEGYTIKRSGLVLTAFDNHIARRRADVTSKRLVRNSEILSRKGAIPLRGKVYAMCTDFYEIKKINYE